jgi:hypothetical protein
VTATATDTTTNRHSTTPHYSSTIRLTINEAHSPQENAWPGTLCRTSHLGAMNSPVTTAAAAAMAAEDGCGTTTNQAWALRSNPVVQSSFHIQLTTAICS